MSEARTEVNETNGLEDVEMNVKLKLAGLWTSFMFLYVYVDIFGFYKPGTIEDILIGEVFTFQITPTFVLVALVFVTIPGLMIFLSLALPARVNRWTNIVVAILYVPFTLYNLVGESWSYMYFGAGIETVLLAIVIWYAWKWPRTTGSSSDSETGSTTALT
ncbi:hypothetical protein GJR96_15930 [Haloferax sp. MBLA0076]|uniref:Uncharacterized protein n=1 Tax=Haloferax litoreum TaxID=2666140 RepID=A0A6A8GKZ0_9EURY|nr:MULTISPECIES: DUF6326 family protein [Haloferax]KAB1190465.1 hypothetical protein Hfx1148_15860 [Haloferax sp. CBA1148]MRX23441.1 hypothetical protein [Haloferax litoreum]